MFIYPRNAWATPAHLGGLPLPPAALGLCSPGGVLPRPRCPCRCGSLCLECSFPAPFPTPMPILSIPYSSSGPCLLSPHHLLTRSGLHLVASREASGPRVGAP